jgi:hypothetical protein
LGHFAFASAIFSGSHNKSETLRMEYSTVSQAITRLGTANCLETKLEMLSDI